MSRATTLKALAGVGVLVLLAGVGADVLLRGGAPQQSCAAVYADFADFLAKNEQLGWKLVEQESSFPLSPIGTELELAHAVTGSFNGREDNHTVVVLTMGGSTPPASRMVALESLQLDLREIFCWEPEQNASLDIDKQLTFQDINGDRRAELVAYVGSGGSLPSGYSVRAWPYNGRRIQELRIDLPEWTVPRRFADVDSDSRLELFALDVSWESHLIGNPDFSRAWFIAAWDDGAYVDRSRDYPAFYESQIEALERSWKDLDAETSTRVLCLRDAQYISLVISMVLNYGRMGNATGGWLLYDELVRPERLKSRYWRDSYQLVRRDLEVSVPPGGGPPGLNPRTFAGPPSLITGCE